MEKSQYYIGAPNGIVLCVDQLQRHQISGKFYHGYSAEEVLFRSETQVLFQMEKLFDDIKFPYPSTDSRTFAAKKQKNSGEQERARLMSDEELLSRHGELGTFIIRVQHRQNSSWQGSITWTEQNRTIYFRSIWEMIKLIESAVNSADGQEENTEKEASWF